MGKSTFEVQDYSVFRNLFSVVSTLLNDIVVIQIKEEGWVIRSFDSACVIVIDILLSKDVFTKYSPANVIDNNIALSTECLKKVFQSVIDSKLKITITDTTIKFKTDSLSLQSKLIGEGLDNIVDPSSFENLDSSMWDILITSDGEEINNKLAKIRNFVNQEDVVFCIKEGKMYIRSENDILNMSVPLNDLDLSTTVAENETILSSKYLQSFLQIKALESLVISLSSSSQAPCKFNFTSKLNKCHVVFYLSEKTSLDNNT